MKSNFRLFLNISSSCNSELHLESTFPGLLRAFEKHTAGWKPALPQFAPSRVGACEDHTPLHTHPQCSPFQSAESGGQWQWTSLSSRHQHCNDTGKLRTAFSQPPAHRWPDEKPASKASKMLSSISLAQVLQASAVQKGGSYHHQEGERTCFSASQPCTCTRLHIKALQKPTFSARFCGLGERVCSNEILYHVLYDLHSIAMFLNHEAKVWTW